MDIFFAILFGFAWLMISILTYLLFQMIYEETDLSYWMGKLKLRTRNILIRIYVVLGPISFVITFVLLILYIFYILLRTIYEWIIDIDSNEV